MKTPALCALATLATASYAHAGATIDAPPYQEATQETRVGAYRVSVREIVTQDGNFCIIATSSAGIALQCHIPDGVEKAVRRP